MPRSSPYGQALTLEDYRRLEAAGEITRPLTQDPIHPRRALTDARLSRLVEPQPRNRKKSEEDEAA